MNKKVVVVTGANRGFGNALCLEFLRHGFHVIGIVRSETSSGILDIKERGISVIVADVCSENFENIARPILNGLTGHVDVLINNAGIPGTGIRLSDVESEEIMRLFQVHCLGALKTCQLCLPLLSVAKKPQIINVSSRLGSVFRAASDKYSLQVSYAYRIAKAAQNMLSVCLFHDLKEAGIEVRAIHPGRMLTSISQEDADLTIEVAAERLYRWLHYEVPFGLYEPFIEQLEW